MAAATTDELLILIRQSGGDQTAAGVRQVGQAVSEAGEAGHRAASGFQASSFTLGNLAMMVTSAVGSIGALATMLGAASGVATAARFRAIALSLEQVTGSATKAHAILGKLKALGAASPYDTAELAGFASRLIAGGTKPGAVVGQLGALTDFAALMQITRSDMPEFMTTLTRLRGRPSLSLEEMEPLTRLAPGFGKILEAGLGMRAGSLPDMNAAIRKAQQIGGPATFDALVKGSERLARGAAIMQAFANPLNVIGNLWENLNMVMEPTGQLLLAVLIPMARFASDIATTLKTLNEWSRGWLGILAIIGALIRIKAVLVNSFWGAIGAVRELNASIQQLAVTARGAAGATMMQSGANNAAMLGPAAGVGWWNAIKAGNIRGGLGIGMAGLKSLGKSALGGLKLLGPGAIGMGLDFAGQAVGGKTGDWMSTIGSGISTGSMIGMLIGSIIPGLGTVAGGAIGAAAGGIAAAISKALERPEGGGESLGRKIDETNRLLGGIDGKMYGGGRRAHAADTQMQLERQLAQMAAAGLG